MISGLHIPHDWYPFNFTRPKIHILLHNISGFEKNLQDSHFYAVKTTAIYLNYLATDFRNFYSTKQHFEFFFLYTYCNKDLYLIPALHF